MIQVFNFLILILLVTNNVFRSNYLYQNAGDTKTDTIPKLGIFQTNSVHTKIDRCKVFSYSFIRTNIKGLKVLHYTVEIEGNGVCFNMMDEKSDRITDEVKKWIADPATRKIYFSNILVGDSIGNKIKLNKNLMLHLKGNKNCLETIK